MTLLLSDSDVRAACRISSLASALDDALRNEIKGEGAVVPERLNLAKGETFLRVMPALMPETGIYGLKFFSGSMANGVRYVVALCALDTGEVLSILDGAYLTAARTGATSGVATNLLARDDAKSVGVLGSGLEAETNLVAIAATRELVEARVYSRSPQRRDAFAERMSQLLRIPVFAKSQPESAVAGADIVLVATNTGLNGPVAYKGDWMEAGQHVVSIGSTAPTLREIDEQCFQRPNLVVFDACVEQVASESGDVMALMNHDPGWARAHSLDALCSGSVLGRSSGTDITLFKSVGTAVQDLVGALVIYREAQAQGIGTKVDDIAEPRVF